MSKNNENKLVPKLRFPEFAKDGEWADATIESVGEVFTGGTPSKEDKEYWDGDFVWVTAQDFKNKYIVDSVLKLTQKGKNKSRIIPKNSVLVTCIASIGLNGINKIECATNQQINSIVCNSENYYEFIYYSITRNGNRLKSLAGQTAVPIINKSAFEKFIIHIPKSFSEQQKIAACLSSLDEVITAERQKLEVLKDHKKGLLQNLFPQAGETVPKFRFKEFEDSGDWVEKTIEQVAKVTTGSKDTQNKDDDGEFPFFVRSQNVERINSYSYDGEAILTSGDGVGVGKNFHYIVGKFDFHQRVYCIYDFEKDVSGRYVYMYFSQHFYERVMRMSAKNSVDSVRRAMITEMPILMPSKKEQQKIADTLSSIDDLINAQNQKLEALQLHKKGLLQGLFPNVNES
jgi:type I restriction enzyme S subunit